MMPNTYDWTTGRCGKHTHDQLKRIQIPGNRIKCGVCNKSKVTAEFSNVAIARIKAAIIEKNAFPDARCISCSSQPLVELTCCSCKKVKGLNAFAKTYRKTPDDAWCFGCADERNELDLDEIGAIPNKVDSDSNSEGHETDSDLDDGDDDGDEALRTISLKRAKQDASSVADLRESDTSADTDSSCTRTYASSSGTINSSSAAAFLNRRAYATHSEASITTAIGGASSTTSTPENTSVYGTYGSRPGSGAVVFTNTPVTKSKERFPKVPAFGSFKKGPQRPPSDDAAPVLSDSSDDE